MDIKCVDVPSDGNSWMESDMTEILSFTKDTIFMNGVGFEGSHLDSIVLLHRF
jgi:hypothetical protein